MRWKKTQKWYKNVQCCVRKWDRLNDKTYKYIHSYMISALAHTQTPCTHIQFASLCLYQSFSFTFGCMRARPLDKKHSISEIILWAKQLEKHALCQCSIHAWILDFGPTFDTLLLASTLVYVSMCACACLSKKERKPKPNMCGAVRVCTSTYIFLHNIHAEHSMEVFSIGVRIVYITHIFTSNSGCRERADCSN